MRAILVRSTLSLMVVATALCSGCALLEVELSSAPDTVRRHQPVTFDVQVKNRSECPVVPQLILVAFMTASEFDEELSAELPPNPPQELLDFLNEVRAFFDELCSGGHPDLPDLPVFPASCGRSGDVIDCQMSSPISSGDVSMSFATLGERLRCTVDAGMMTCHLRMPILKASGAAQATTQQANGTLTCLTAAELGGVDDAEAICLLGTFPNAEALGPGETATGQVTLPARGEGVVRNLLVGITSDPEDLGVCKGGSAAGEPCDLSDTGECPGSTCGEGICQGGDADGDGCEVATEATDCPNGGTCVVCAEPLENSFLPVDCTETTVIGLEPAPLMSWQAMFATVAILLIFGTLWLQRRTRRRGEDERCQPS